MTQSIITLTGLKGSGKTTVAEYLVSKHNYIDYALADPLKKIAKIFGFTDKELYGTQEDKLTINPKLNICAREFLQKIGTEVFRHQLSQILPNMNLGSSNIIWIKLMEDFIKANPYKNICISDARFLDEILATKQFPGSIVIKIERPRKRRTGRFDIEDLDVYESHASESSVSNEYVDYVVSNDGTIEELCNKIDSILNEHAMGKLVEKFINRKKSKFDVVDLD